MASTLTINQSITWAQYFMGNRPLALSPNEPALTSGNMVKQVMLSPPFKWRWNRALARVPVSASASGADVVVSIPSFGFIEKAQISATFGTNAGKAIEIPEIATELTQDGQQGRPNTIAAYLDDNAGNISFRFMPGTPDVDSEVVVIYQQKPTLLTSLTQTWA